MFNLGFSEMVLLGIIALIFIGPKQLPEVARVIARTLNEFKRATADITKPFTDLKSEAKQMADKARSSVFDPEKFLSENEDLKKMQADDGGGETETSVGLTEPQPSSEEIPLENSETPKETLTHTHRQKDKKGASE